MSNAMMGLGKSSNIKLGGVAGAAIGSKEEGNEITEALPKMNTNKILNTEEKKVNFLKGLIRVAKCDAVIDEREVLFYKQLALSMELSEDAINETASAWEKDYIEVYFENSIEKMFFFTQVIQLCHIDESYNALEKAEILTLANELGISVKAISKVESWVEEGMAWSKRGSELLVLK